MNYERPFIFLKQLFSNSFLFVTFTIMVFLVQVLFAANPGPNLWKTASMNWSLAGNEC